LAFELNNGRLYYMQANDAAGTVWQVPEIVSLGGGEDLDFISYLGQPALSYFSYTPPTGKSATVAVLPAT
jgi:hypothetical protein